MKIFAEKGYTNTPEVVAIVKEYVKEHPYIHNLVMASKTGYTIDMFLEAFAAENIDVNFTIVTHCYGDLGPGQCEMTPEKRQALEKRLGDWVLKNFETQNMDMLFLKIHDLESYKATISCYGDGAVECAATAFPNMDSNKVLLEKNLSRKKIVRLLQPQIEKWATAHQQKDAA